MNAWIGWIEWLTVSEVLPINIALLKYCFRSCLGFSTRDSEPRNEKHSMDDFLQPGLGRWQARLLQPSALTAFSNRLLQPLFSALTALGALTAHYSF